MKILRLLAILCLLPWGVYGQYKPNSYDTQTDAVVAALIKANVGSQIAGSNYLASPMLGTLDMNSNNIVNQKSYWTREVNIRAFGAKGDGVTDDTAALQAAIDSLTNNGVGGTVKLPDGLYRINGAFTEATGSSNGLTHSQIHLPVRSLGNQTICPITIEGITEPTLNTIWNNSSLPAVNTNGAIIISTNIPADPSYTIIGGAGPVGAPVNHTAVFLTLNNLTFRVYDNPQTTPLNLRYVAQAIVQNCVVDTGQPGGTQSQPTHAAVGIIMPDINNWVISRIRNVDVRGFDIGYQLNEHSDVDDARVWMVNKGWYFPGGTHGIHMGHTVTTGATIGVIGGPTGGFIQRLDWDMYAVEHSILPGGGAWANTVADFWDTNSVIKGVVNFASVDSGVGGGDTFTVNGSTNIVFLNANSSSFSKVKIRPLKTNDVDSNYLLTMKDFNKAGVLNAGIYLQPFQYYSGIWLGPSFYDQWMLATNFALLGNGTNSTAINAPMPEGGDANGSVLQFQVGHLTKMSLSNNLFTVSVPMNHGFLAISNFTSGQFYTNTWTAPLHVSAVIQLVTATVTGNAAMQLWIGGTITNSQGINTSAAQAADSGDFRQIQGDIPPGSFYCFTNTSTGVGNSATLFKAQVKGD